MAVKLRLRRVGAHKDPIWRVVVADSRSPRDGRVIETIGHYNPQRNPSVVEIDLERARHWLARGAQPTEAVSKLLRICEGKATPPKERPKASAAPPEPIAEPTGDEPPAEVEAEGGAEPEGAAQAEEAAGQEQ
jgi:small subunit ribosomal protein S16